MNNIPTPPPRHSKKFRRAGRWFLLVALFLAPWFFLPLTDDPGGINLFFVVGVLALASFICFIGCTLEERRIEYPRSWLALAIILLLAVQAVSAWFSIVPGQSFWGGLSAPDSFAAFIIYILLFLFSFFFFRPEDIPKMAAAAGLGLLIGTIINFFHLATVNFGWGIMLAAVVAALAVVRPGEFAGWKKVAFFIVMAVAIAGLAVLNYQSLWLMLAVFVAIAAVLRFEPREHFYYAFALIVIALFFALISPRLAGFLQAPQDLRPGVAATATATQGVLRTDNLLIGSGPSTFAFDFELFRPASINEKSFWAQTFSEGHDFAVTLLATGGLLSFLLFLAIFILAIQIFLHIELLDTKNAMAISSAMFLLAALFVYPGFFAEFVILFSLLGVLDGKFSRHSISFNEWPRVGSFGFSLVLLALAAAGLAAIFLTGEQYAAAVLFGQSNALAAGGNYSEAFAKVSAAIAINPSDEYIRAASQVILSEARVLASSTDSTASAEMPTAIASAIQMAQNAVLENSHDPANWGNLGSIYEAALPVANGADALAEGSYQNAATLDPENPEWDVSIARVYMESAGLLATDAPNQPTIQADWNSAERFLQKAISLKDDYADPRVLLVRLYLEEGNIPQAIQRVQELAQQNPLDPGIAFELGYLYYNTNQLSQAAQEFQLAILLNPDYANARYFLDLIKDEQ